VTENRIANNCYHESKIVLKGNLKMSDKVTGKFAGMTIETESGAVSGTRGTAKRDTLRANEVAVQKIWDEEKVFETEPDDRESFMVTFPYPYSNGHLHIGHAFSLTKAIFRAQFERHRGKNVLFPFAFHCTGMPIQAVR
jgi:leucyl-tRNA synthetase